MLIVGLLQETGHTFICFLLEYFEVSKEAGPISDDERVMHRLTYNANNAKVRSYLTVTAFCGAS